ncbi:Fatty-acid amide hydrolase 2 [Aphelenchoides besseyi]|nr:Fatty-acid amide hydrolase 2 [Aphelenchoides besseyi]KAI6199251.1 Fatty-acid amide hydrolase 2 [Aphelenchoides besseyi]
MFFDETQIVAMFVRPFAPLIVLLIQIYYQLVHYVYIIFTWKKPKHVVPRIGLEADDQLVLYSAVELADKIRHRAFSVTRVVEAYIKRIETVNPIINAVVQRNYDEARQVAREYDDYLGVLETSSNEYKKLGETKPLLGVPFSVKDHFDVQGLLNSAGLPCRRNAKPAEKDSGLVEALKAAGGIPIAMTNVPEGLLHMETINTVFGRTCNPYDDRLTCGGSSGGEAALVASAGSVFGIGSDIGGSIRIPALFCGVFGLKPTRAMTPMDGMIPSKLPDAQANMLSIGPICRSARDLKPLLKVFIGPKNSTRLRLDKPVNLESIRIFTQNGPTGRVSSAPLDWDVQKAHSNAIEVLERCINRPSIQLNLDLTRYASDFWFAHFSALEAMPWDNQLDFVREFRLWLSGKSEHTTAAIEATAMDWFCRRFVNSDIDQILRLKDRLHAQLIEVLGDDGILVWPSFPHSSYRHNELLWTPLHTETTALWNALSFPVVTCPVGLNSSGIPVGVQIVAAPDNERILCAIAELLEEELSGWRCPPGPML